jgi:peroxiredoxin
MLETDDDGRAQARDLPAGLVHVFVRYDRSSATTRLLVEPKPVNDVATVHFLPFSFPRERLQRPAVGSSAPEWKLGAWTDGQERSLAEYRGKVLVIGFWSMGFGPPAVSFGAVQRLAEAYESKGVAFVGIHTPDGDLEQIRKLKHSQGWTAPTAIDQADSNANGRTGLAYGAFGRPALVIVDAQGTIAYYSDSDASLQQALGEVQRKHSEATAGRLRNSTEAEDETVREASSRIVFEHLSHELDRIMDAK